MVCRFPSHGGSIESGFEAARAAQIPIIYSARQVDTGGTLSPKSAKRRKRNPDAYDIWSDHVPQSGDTIIYKERASKLYKFSVSRKF